MAGIAGSVLLVARFADVFRRAGTAAAPPADTTIGFSVILFLVILANNFLDCFPVIVPNERAPNHQKFLSVGLRVYENEEYRMERVAGARGAPFRLPAPGIPVCSTMRVACHYARLSR